MDIDSLGMRGIWTITSPSWAVTAWSGMSIVSMGPMSASTSYDAVS